MQANQVTIWKHYTNLKLKAQLLLCILTCFWVLLAPESCSKYFLGAIFNLFLYPLRKSTSVCMSTSFFQKFFYFSQKITEKCLKWTKKVVNGQKVFRAAFGCVQHPKADPNTQNSVSSEVFYNARSDLKKVHCSFIFSFRVSRRNLLLFSLVLNHL